MKAHMMRLAGITYSFLLFYDQAIPSLTLFHTTSQLLMCTFLLLLLSSLCSCPVHIPLIITPAFQNCYIASIFTKAYEIVQSLYLM
jgi:hypothetical protein